MADEEEDSIYQPEQEEEDSVIYIDNIDKYNSASVYEGVINTATNPKQYFTTSKYMTKFELARIIGLRSQQIAAGASPLVAKINVRRPYDIAIQELTEGKLPIIVVRPLPNGTASYIHCSDLIIPPKLFQAM